MTLVLTFCDCGIPLTDTTRGTDTECRSCAADRKRSERLAKRDGVLRVYRTKKGFTLTDKGDGFLYGSDERIVVQRNSGEKIGFTLYVDGVLHRGAAQVRLADIKEALDMSTVDELHKTAMGWIPNGNDPAASKMLRQYNLSKWGAAKPLTKTARARKYGAWRTGDDLIYYLDTYDMYMAV